MLMERRNGILPFIHGNRCGELAVSRITLRQG